MTDLDPRWFDEAPCACVVTSMDGVIKWNNRTFGDWVGHSNLDSADGSLIEMLTVPSRIRFDTFSASLNLNGHLSDIRLDVRRVDGSILSLLCSASVFREDSGVVSEICWVGLDVSERQAYERDLLIAQRRLRRLQDLSAALVGATEVAEVAEALLGTFVDGVKADHGAVYLGGERLTLKRVAVRVTDNSADVDDMADALPDHVLRVFDSLEPDFTVDAEPARPKVSGVSQPWHVATLPLRGDERIVGVVEFGMSRRQPHSSRERQLLQSAVEMAAQAVERVQLLDRLTRSVEENRAAAALLHRLEEATTVAARAELIVDFAVPEYADMATIELQGAGVAPIALRHVDPTMEPTLKWLRSNVEVSPETEFSLAAGRELQQPQVLNNILPSMYDNFELDEPQRKALGLIKPSAYLGLPLIGRFGVTGSMMLAHSNPDRVFLPDDVDFLSRVADTCALALENARLYEHERSVAERLQTALLPARLPEDPRVRLEGFHQAGHQMSSVGGDWYDAFMIDDRRLGLVVGDVVGGGIGAATAMGALRVATRAFALDGHGAIDVIDRLNRFSTTVDGASASSVIYAELDLASFWLRYASAGHLPALVHRPGHSPTALWGGRRPLLGVRDTPASQGEVQLDCGWSVVLYTDGLVERRNQNIDDGIAELSSVLESDPLITEVPARLARVMKTEAHGDDTCILVATITEPLGDL